jgi:hypothetical protein
MKVLSLVILFCWKLKLQPAVSGTEHTDAMAYYVQHYAQTEKPVNPKECLIVSIDSDAMVIKFHGKKNSHDKEEMKNVTIPFDPPLADAKEARFRLIDMMWECVHALGMVRSFFSR